MVKEASPRWHIPFAESDMSITAFCWSCGNLGIGRADTPGEWCFPTPGGRADDKCKLGQPANAAAALHQLMTVHAQPLRETAQTATGNANSTSPNSMPQTACLTI
jgi:hypothetical protein